jgi:hypothetical protein
LWLLLSRGFVVTEMKDIPGFPGYKATVDGKIWSDKSRRFLRQYSEIGGYPKIDLSVSCKKIKCKVHRLIAETFCEKPEGCNVVNHLDNTKTNNHASNLEWGTQSSNLRYAASQGRMVNAKSCKIKESDLDFIWSRYNESIESTAKILGLGKAHVLAIYQGKAWAHTYQRYKNIWSKPRDKVTTPLKLNKESVLGIFHNVAKSSTKELALKFKVDVSLISQIRLGKIHCQYTWFLVKPVKWPKSVPTPPNVDTSDWGFS